MAHIVKQIRSRVLRPMKSVGEGVLGSIANRVIEKVKVDPRITYPCYKSFDEFIDVERLKSLDEYITEKIKKHAEAYGDERFYTGPLTTESSAPKRPGSRIIYLSRSQRPYNYAGYLNTNPELWERTREAGEFSLLMDFIETLPFKATARMMIMYDDTGHPVTAHRDHVGIRSCYEFVWFRTNLNKPFYVFNQKTGTKRYVESYSAWFDTCNQFHGADSHEGLSFSIRVDGIFSDEFRKRIPTPSRNLASTPALWACISG